MYSMILIFSCFYKYVLIRFNFLLIMNSVFYELYEFLYYMNLSFFYYVSFVIFYSFNILLYKNGNGII